MFRPNSEITYLNMCIHAFGISICSLNYSDVLNSLVLVPSCVCLVLFMKETIDFEGVKLILPRELFF